MVESPKRMEKNDLPVIKIATQTPFSGGSATIGEVIKLGAQLALDDQKEKFKELGFELQLVPYDDQADPKKGVANAQLIGADKLYWQLLVTSTQASLSHLRKSMKNTVFQWFHQPILQRKLRIED